jgi:hypothetical protein
MTGNKITPQTVAEASDKASDEVPDSGQNRKRIAGGRDWKKFYSYTYVTPREDYHQSEQTVVLNLSQ